MNQEMGQILLTLYTRIVAIIYCETRQIFLKIREYFMGRVRLQACRSKLEILSDLFFELDDGSRVR